MKEVILPIAGVIVFITVVGLITQRMDSGEFQNTFPIQQPSNVTTTPESRPTVVINEVEIPVELADDNAERSRGLSGKESLEEGTGMLFVFENKSQPVFWMKDMNFPIDIIWIEDDTVVKINKNVQAPAPGVNEENLARYSPGQAVNYVLEVNAGFSDEIEVNVGDKIDVSIE